MKISRRSVLHISGLAAAALALTGCSAAGSAALGGKLPGLLKSLTKKGETAASSEAASDMAVTPPPEGEPLVPALPEYDADILTGAERSTNSRPVAVMVDNIATGAAGETLEDWFDAFGDDLIHMHFLDGDPWLHNVWGDGNTSLSRQLQIMQAHHFTGYLVQEVADEHYFTDPFSADRRNFRVLERFLED